MARFGNPFIPYSDGSGNILAGGKIYFYSTGTADLLDTYMDVNLSIANTNPVIIDLAGFAGNIFLKEQSYKVVVKDSDDVMIPFGEADPISSSLGTGNFSTWNALTIYSTGQIVTASDGNSYESITDANQGNDPTAATTNWQRVQLIPTWNSLVTYPDDQIVIGSNGFLYSSKIASNLNNDPTVSPTEWLDLTSADNLILNGIKTANFTAVAGNYYPCDTSGGAFTMTFPITPTVGDVVGVVDYAGTFDSNNLTLGRNGSDVMRATADGTIDNENWTTAWEYFTNGWLARGF